MARPLQLKQPARVPQAQDEALQLQKAEVALKDPENDAEPAMSLAAQEPPAVRALAIGPVTEPVTTPAQKKRASSQREIPTSKRMGCPHYWIRPG